MVVVVEIVVVDILDAPLLTVIIIIIIVKIHMVYQASNIPMPALLQDH